MYTPVAVVEGPYLKDILEQPAALARTLESLPDLKSLRESLQPLLRGTGQKRIVLTGMGSSCHALHPISIRLNRAGYVAQIFETSELLTHYREILRPGTFTVVVSQSGESAEVTRLLREAPADLAVVGVTNSAESTLARRANIPVLTSAGLESTVSCKTYLCTLMALHWIASAILDDDPYALRTSLEAVNAEVERYLQDWQAHVDWLMERISGTERVFVTGRGWSLATAGTGGLILKESTRIAAEGLSSAAFRHGPLESLSAKVLACICAGDSGVEEMNRRLSVDVRCAGGRSLLIGSRSDAAALRVHAEAELLPIVEILPLQMLSLATAALLGEEAGRFVLASKITTVE